MLGIIRFVLSFIDKNVFYCVNKYEILLYLYIGKCSKLGFRSECLTFLVN